MACMRMSFELYTTGAQGFPAGNAVTEDTFLPAHQPEKRSYRIQLRRTCGVVNAQTTPSLPAYTGEFLKPLRQKKKKNESASNNC